MPSRDDGDDLEKLASIDLSDVELETELYSKSFRDFVEPAFRVVAPNEPYEDNWHIGAIAEHLQAVADGEITRLLINQPPGTMKSLLCSVLWPAWMWGREPWLKFICSSYAEVFTKRDSRRMRNLVRSAWYRQRFPKVKLARASRAEDAVEVSDTVLEWGTTEGGFRTGASTSSGVTGKHVNGIVEDDPLKQQDAMSKAKREAAWNYHSATLSGRLLPGAKNFRVMSMQRLHVDDPSGRILKEGGWEALVLPMHFSRKHFVAMPLGNMDPREDDGELLWPSRMDEKYVAQRCKDLTPHEASAQEEQRPTALEGGVIKRADFERRWTKASLPTEWEVEWISADLALTDTGDPIAVQLWGYKNGDFYLRKRMTDRMGLAESYAIVLQFARLSRAAVTMAKVIENKANGPAMLNLNRNLRTKIPGFEPFTPKGEKIVRLNAVSPVFRSKCVIVPDEAEDPGIEDYIEQLCGMPAVRHDDEADATSQAILWFQERHGEIIDLALGDIGVGTNELRDPSEQDLVLDLDS